MRDRAHELVPPEVGFCPVEDEQVLALVVLDEIQDELGRYDALVGVTGIGHDGTAGAIVDESVDVEGGHALVRQGHQELLDGEGACMTGVHRAVEVMQEHARGHGIRGRVLDGVQRSHCSSSRASRRSSRMRSVRTERIPTTASVCNIPLRRRVPMTAGAWTTPPPRSCHILGLFVAGAAGLVGE